MRARQLIVALLVALLVSGGFTLWLSKRVVKTGTAAPQGQRYVAAARALEAGQLLKPEDLKVVQWPAATRIHGTFLTTADVVGRTVLYPLAVDEPILDRHLAAPGSGVGLTAKIPLGMRAISLKSDDIVGVAGFLLPGTHVDVLVTYRPDKSPEPTTATVQQDVEVLAAGHQIQPDPEGKPSSVGVVTLLLSPMAAEKVALASTQGTIHFVLRNGSDRAQTNDVPVELSQLADIPHPSAAGKAALAHPAYVVETVLGNKRIASTFNRDGLCR